MNKVFQLRAGNASTVNDVVELRGYLNRKFEWVEDRLLERRSSCTTPGSPTRPGDESRPDSPVTRRRKSSSIGSLISVPTVSNENEAVVVVPGSSEPAVSKPDQPSP